MLGEWIDQHGNELMSKGAGLHHVTAVSGMPKENVAFYTQVLGLRMVKQTVNYDDPGTWHLYYGDGPANPGSILTFFPWTHVGPRRAGSGEAGETWFQAPLASLGFWVERLAQAGVAFTQGERFGVPVLVFRDPHQMDLSMAFMGDEAASTPVWTSPVAQDMAISGFAGVTLHVARPDKTARWLTEAFGWHFVQEQDGRSRFSAGGTGLGQWIDLVASPLPMAQLGAGSVHHIAFRAGSDEAQAGMAEQLRAMGIQTTEQKDRNYFRSVYCREPSGIIVEIATDQPGFDVDEPLAEIGKSLKLPPWLEPHRADIVAALPPLV